MPNIGSRSGAVMQSTCSIQTMFAAVVTIIVLLLGGSLPAWADAIDDAIKLYEEGIADAKKCCVNKTVQAKLKDEYEAQTALDDLKNPWPDYVNDQIKPGKKGSDEEIAKAEQALKDAQELTNDAAGGADDEKLKCYRKAQKKIYDARNQVKDNWKIVGQLRQSVNYQQSGEAQAKHRKAQMMRLKSRPSALALAHPCPPPGATGTYEPLPEGTAYVSSDGTAWCTFGEGTGEFVALTPTDDTRVPVAFAPPSKPPPTGGEKPPALTDSPPSNGVPPPASERPPTTALVPPTRPTRPETPATTTDTPPTPATPPTTDTPPQIPDTVFVKASEAVLEGGRTGSELQNQTVKLVFDKPDLPGSGASKSAQDTGFDRDPAQCTTGANGECKIQVHPDDRPLYGLASAGAKPGHHRLDLNLLKHSGAVAETTGKTVPDLKNATPAGGNIATSEFKIGNRKFTRLGIDEPYGRSEDRAAYSRALGSNAETDYCRTKKPGPLGMEPTSLGALNHELPESTLRLKNRTDGMR